MTIEHIIFDWDGTLAKTLDLWLAGYREAFDTRGHEFSDQTIVSEFFHNHDDVLTRYPDLGFNVIADEARNSVFVGLETVDLYAGAETLCRHAKQALQNATLVTSSPRHVLMRGLNAHGLEQEFASIVAGDDGFGHKPSTLPFEETLRRIDARPENTLIIGDTHVDIEAGKKLGCKTCWFAPDHNSFFHDFPFIRGLNPDFEVSTLDEVLELI